MAKARDLSAPPPPKARRSDSQAIVEAILQAAAELGTEAPVQDIAERAGVGVASVYRYFPGKDAIAAELGRRAYTAIVDAMRQALDAAETPDDAILACCALALEAPFSPDPVRRHVNTTVPFTWLGEAPERMFVELIELFTFASARWVDQPEEERRLRAHTAISMVRGVTHARLLLPHLAPPLEDVLPMLQTSLRACLGIQPEI